MHSHPEYGHGQYGQQPVPVRGQCCGYGCLHNVQSWNGVPWLNMHVIGLQFHAWNQCEVFTGPSIQYMEAVVFGQDGLHAPSGLSRRLKVVHHRNEVTWYIMDCKGSKYCGLQGICNICGVVMWCAWSPTSTRGWRDHQRANFLAFLGLEVPEF